VLGDPRVEGGDRFFEQRQVRELRLAGRFDRQLARLLVERRRHGEHDPLALEAQTGVFAAIVAFHASRMCIR